MEARGFTRRAVRNLSKPGKRGARARETVSTLVKIGAIRYLKDLAETLPDGENRNTLREMLEECGTPSDGASPHTASADEAYAGEAPPDGDPLEGASSDVTSESGIPSGDVARREG